MAAGWYAFVGVCVGVDIGVSNGIVIGREGEGGGGVKFESSCDSVC